MQQKNMWLLPEGIEETLPLQALHLEQLRAKLLSTFQCWGYQLVIPPFIDFLDSLLIGSGHDLDLQTFKLTDQLSGELLGIRADMTPQVARIDAHHLSHDAPNRLCYVGTVLHTRGDPLEKSRSPMQIGAELYGDAGCDSDVEVICLMLEMLALTGLENVHLDLGHVGIYRALVEQAQLSPSQESQLFAVLQRKANHELHELLLSYRLAPQLSLSLLTLAQLNGDKQVLTQASALLNTDNAVVSQALNDLRAIADKLSARFPHLSISFDLAELRGYHYHTGVVFAAFIPQLGKEIARGGRYDNIGAAFGRARPATGFSADLKVLSALSKNHAALHAAPLRIFAPYAPDDVSLAETVRDLRAQGQIVIAQLALQTASASDLGCTAQLELHQQQWLVTALA